MSNDYEEFVKYVFEEHIQPRLKRMGHWMHFHNDAEYEIDRLRKSMRTLRLIRDYTESDEDVMRIFTPELLKQTLGDINYGIRFNNRLVVDTEIADVIQDYFGEIVEGMTVDHFPKEDFEVLQQSGNSNPRREVAATVYLMKSRKDRFMREGRNIRFSSGLVQTAEHIERLSKSVPEKTASESGDSWGAWFGQEAAPGVPEKTASESGNQPMVKRAMFKGIGSIVQGALLTVTNVSLVAGWWNVSLSPETTSVGAVVSITSGIGTILTGIGELRGE